MPDNLDKADPAVQPPSRVPWPPLLLAGAIGIGVGLNHTVPSPLFGGIFARGVGVCLSAAAVSLDLAAILTLVRHRTTVLPHRGSDALVTTGPFALSRNPIYFGNVLLTAGLAFSFANAWLLAAAAVESVLLRRLAIGPEERHLGARFGDAWRAYAARTPRWIGGMSSRRDGGNRHLRS